MHVHAHVHAHAAHAHVRGEGCGCACQWCGVQGRRLRREHVGEQLLARLHLLHDVLRAHVRALPVLRVAQQAGAPARRVAQAERVEDERPVRGARGRAERVGLQARCMRLQPGCMGCSLGAWVAARRPSVPGHERDEGRVVIVFNDVAVIVPVGVAAGSTADRGLQLRPPDQEAAHCREHSDERCLRDDLKGEHGVQEPLVDQKHRDGPPGRGWYGGMGLAAWGTPGWLGPGCMGCRLGAWGVQAGCMGLQAGCMGCAGWVHGVAGWVHGAAAASRRRTLAAAARWARRG